MESQRDGTPPMFHAERCVSSSEGSTPCDIVIVSHHLHVPSSATTVQPLQFVISLHSPQHPEFSQHFFTVRSDQLLIDSSLLHELHRFLQCDLLDSVRSTSTCSLLPEPVKERVQHLLDANLSHHQRHTSITAQSGAWWQRPAFSNLTNSTINSLPVIVATIAACTISNRIDETIKRKCQHEIGIVPMLEAILDQCTTCTFADEHHQHSFNATLFQWMESCVTLTHTSKSLPLAQVWKWNENFKWTLIAVFGSDCIKLQGDSSCIAKFESVTLQSILDGSILRG